MHLQIVLHLISTEYNGIEFTFGINGSLRKRVNNVDEKTEYYLFDAFNQMIAYSDNDETYGYYGYDDAGQRIYKMQLNVLSSNTSTFPNTKILEAEKFMLYSSGYLNIDQHTNALTWYFSNGHH